MQESVFQRLLLGDVPVGATNLKAGYLHPADVSHGDATSPVELDEGAVAREVGQKEVAHLPEEASMNDTTLLEVRSFNGRMSLAGRIPYDNQSDAPVLKDYQSNS